jgi:hypothetical protein
VNDPNTLTAAERVRAYLDARGSERHDVIATAGPRDERYNKPRLRGSDILAVLDEHSALTKRIAELEAERTEGRTAP